MKSLVSLKVNGRQRDDAVSGNLLLVDYLREVVGRPAQKSVAMAANAVCAPFSSTASAACCLTLAGSCDGASVKTIRSLSDGGRLNAIQRLSRKTRGPVRFLYARMVMAAEGLLRTNPDPDEATIRTEMASNICRCTGYVKIIEAVRFAADELKSETEAA